MKTWSERRARAQADLAEVSRLVERQRKLVSSIEPGERRQWAEALLDTLERSLELFEDDLAAVLRERAPH